MVCVESTAQSDSANLTTTRGDPGQKRNAALPELLAGIRLGLIRGVKGVVIGQLLVSVVAFGRLFATYSRNFMFDDFWALAIVMFAFALGLSGLIGKLEQRVEYYAGTRD